ncbi:hypothetical protein ACLB1E_20220 [Escherichia coli]
MVPSAGRTPFRTIFRCGASLLKFRREFDQYVNLCLVCCPFLAFPARWRENSLVMSIFTRSGKHRGEYSSLAVE